MTEADALPLVRRAHAHAERTAIVAPEGTFSYQELLDASACVASGLLRDAGDLAEARVALLVPPGFDYVAVQWGIWRAGGVAVPLGIAHPPPELDYAIRDSGAAVVVAHPDLTSTAEPLAAAAKARFLTSARALAAEQRPLPAIAETRRALMVYTSGTTGRPKGVVSTHATLRAQVSSLVEAWGWSADDRVLLTLPLHHLHGILNVLTCALWSGARCEMLPRFEAEAVWSRIERGDLTLFMAIPTIYARLIAAWEAASPERRRALSEGCGQLRLMVSGSAALPGRTLERWREISGHVLLERYGMTETGMVLSNPLDGERVPGHVGQPLPGVEVRLVADAGRTAQPGEPGELLVRGPGVFVEYWQRPAETEQAFDDGWFRTGDVGVLEAGGYRLLGRRSVDIIKTGGYKVSALEIEDVMRSHPEVADCAVVGIEDAEWGERVCAAIETRGEAASVASLEQWARRQLAPYKVPRTFRLVSSLPRNALGKVTKPQVAALFASHAGPV